ncbi:glycosyltransferase family 2 protein [Phaeobacter sp.]|uniref:glycosyltransferase family 2 protein n=1 Tax=Phaeobacter sp. TaxID=1902409 RepID=UPI0025DA653B|nr:glycosyltransferase family 2 protein [Phaeobacter sp.]
MVVNPATWSKVAELPPISLAAAYRLRWKRRQLLWRAFRARRQLRLIADRTSSAGPDPILAFTVLRNEIARLRFFLSFYRALGVGHFLMVDNGSDDGTLAYLADQPDVSLWSCTASYRAARFGLDWLTWLQIRYGHNRWCLTVDADELLVFGGDQSHGLRGLTDHLQRRGVSGFGALMLDLFPKGRLSDTNGDADMDPRKLLPWFDPGPFRAVRQRPRGNLWVQGGLRERVFFADQPHRSPTLNKLPLVRWNRRFAYTNSTHAALPRRLNALYDGPGGSLPSGALLHSKFLPQVVAASRVEKQRRQHFHDPDQFADYYDHISVDPDLWHAGAVQYTGPEQLEQLGLICPIDWDQPQGTQPA